MKLELVLRAKKAAKLALSSRNVTETTDYILYVRMAAYDVK